jgi:thiamine-phosphate pyrophosphorylase
VTGDDGEAVGLLPFRLLAIGDRRQAVPAAVRAAADEAGGALAVLLRHPGLPEPEVRRWTEAVLAACRDAGALLLVHADPDLARRAGADGVHLPERMCLRTARLAVGSAILVGASRHDEAGVRRAAEDGADYATLSPVFESPGKAPPLGVGAFERVCIAAPLPLVALGGVTPERVTACRTAGAAAVAAIRAVWDGDVAANVRRLLGGPDP